ncbi:MAG TPA: type III-B CRISPR module RAMP protein Cmr1 [Thermoanaerobaculia bacterium]|jgi:CRISPR-associated protein Cmr1|nr:type III-B CRISPR module RAMP protein Cmr1 [Thermoanaerobaculia bacterium]
MLRQTFKVEFVTPCFLGGARDQAEWRGASIRGQLRWWFRAVAGAHFVQDLEKVRAAEEEIFGSTRRCSALRVLPGLGPEAERPDPAGIPFSESLEAKEIAKRWGDKSEATVNRLRLQSRFSDPLHYLAYGPVTRGRLERPFLPASTSVSFDLQWVREPGGDLPELFASALWAWLYLGGIGARSRKGFGSLHLQHGPASWKAPLNQDAFRNEAGKLLALGRRIDGEPAWTCFSQSSRIFVGSEGFKTGEEALSRLGGWLIAFRRRYGKATDTRTFGGQPVAGRDYEWAAPNGTKLRQGIPDRVGFGLPLPFTRRVDDQFRGESVIWGEDGKDEKDPRRASPLLLHVARFENLYFPVLTWLPAQFLPQKARLGFKGHPFPAEGQVEPARPGIVSYFLDDLVGRKRLVAEIGASS